ncbi:MAG: UDP-N-acetylmuramoyl-tripeptide--D-alanyl-D-alanine ligase [Candidatus Glassbacteria bacterium]|nr:UDP-N-acetylmuramoyl-tripeptide--D-alanyl-D-alanine ligase [Candidatus Glassbacteria bacterium]
MELTTSKIIAALPGCNLGGDTAERTYRGVATDTRSNCDGRLFVALRGESFDANAFLEQAAQAGAMGALVGPSVKNYPRPEGLQYFETADTLKALQHLGAHLRQLASGLRVIAVTGSNGKSTTKEMISAVVRTSWRTHATVGNFNNHVGVPLTLLSMPEGTELLVAELGANHPGEIRELARMVRPDISVITNVAPAHLEGFGSLEGVLHSKTELFEETTPGGTCIYCGDDKLLSDYVPGRFERTVTFGLEPGNDIAAAALELDDSGAPSFTLADGPRIELALPGRYNVLNALAAVAAGRALGLDDLKIKEGLEAVRPMEMRGTLRRIGRWTVLDDSYNANPLSMAEALNTLMALRHDGPRVAVLGQMLELGPAARRLHEQLAADAAARGLDMAVMVGEYAGDMKNAWMDAGGEAAKIFTASDADEAWAILNKNLGGGELLLVKASRRIRLERVIEQMTESEGA